MYFRISWYPGRCRRSALRITNASRHAQSPSWKTAWAHGFSLGSLRLERRLPAPSPRSSLLGSVRIFGRITCDSEKGAAHNPTGLGMRNALLVDLRPGPLLANFFRGLASSRRWTKRKPPQVVRDDQHCTRFMREFRDSWGWRGDCLVAVAEVNLAYAYVHSGKPSAAHGLHTSPYLATSLRRRRMERPIRTRS